MKFIKKKEVISDIHINEKMSHGLKRLILLKCLNALSRAIPRFGHSTYQNVNGILHRVGKTIVKSYGLIKDTEFTKQFYAKITEKASQY